ncbi:MAG: hypothetical protein F6K09_00470 [Merismopedia sp. SIO2A8]|nr:hypothetical protein [Symploca sp. SIO2B6]NET47241.1 hypothetical protein [Merismopedia sp. SIO2A8]
MKLLQQIVQRRHLLAWLGTWTLMMVMAWGAIAILLNPNLGIRPTPPQLAQQSRIDPTSTNSERAERTTLPSISTAPTSPRAEPSPARFRQTNHEETILWSLGIVTIACIYGSVILTQHIKGLNRRG